jgi:hypothetical protein
MITGCKKGVSIKFVYTFFVDIFPAYMYFVDVLKGD